MYLFKCYGLGSAVELNTRTKFPKWHTPLQPLKFVLRLKSRFTLNTHTHFYQQTKSHLFFLRANSYLDKKWVSSVGKFTKGKTESNSSHLL